MEGNCSNPDCTGINCHDGYEDLTQCPNWSKHHVEEVKKKTIQKKTNKSTQVWSGEPLTINDINLISYRNNPIIIGLAGKAKAGKTCFLGMLYTLLYEGGRFEKYGFSGTKTILGWDKLYDKLKVVNKKVSLPETTPSSYLRLLHLALRNIENQLTDVLITDASGEVFSTWSQNKDDENAENARWIYDNSNGFILFIDCDDLIKRKNRAKTEIIDIAEMLKSDLKNRPVLVVWSKADLKEDVHPTIHDSLKNELSEIFNNYIEIDISNYPSKNPDVLVHKNNLKTIDWLLDKIIIPTGVNIAIRNEYENDVFLNYKGQ